MAKSSKSSSQGIQSNKKVNVGVKTGAGARGVTAGHAGQIGGALGTHVMGQGGKEVHGAQEPVMAPKPYSTGFGNEVALNVGKGGAGTGRTIHASGSQAHHGPPERGERTQVNPGPKDILRDYGPEIGGRRKR